MGLEDGGKVLLVIGVVNAVLRLVFLNAVDCAVGGERENGGGWSLVEILGSIETILKAVQVFRLWVN